ncbi:MAG: hypothetical protein JO320_14905 [Alphaproteobacteria bacterium]|nr:hypothetical protein [Alphaproteobacteria bacterium]MBV9376324.1 hypothetical protein [Alphaproteobacteria bacterium]
MPKANIHRRSTLEEVYPPDAFASDAAHNDRVPSETVNGVRILSKPDAGGDFEFERATRQTGEAGSAAFLAPHRREDRIEGAGRDSPTNVSAIPDPQEGYEDFLADIIAAAQRFGFVAEQSPGRDEPRLRGLRQ